MKVATAPTLHSSVVDLILQARELSRSLRYAEALKMITQARTEEPRNIYLIALEKQCSKLLEALASDVTSTNVDELATKLPGLFDRAMDASHVVAGSAAAAQAVGDDGEHEKERRLQVLKSQYFRRADEFMEHGEYESALAEVRRVLIIDPGNVAARKYEEKIRQIGELLHVSGVAPTVFSTPVPTTQAQAPEKPARVESSAPAVKAEVPEPVETPRKRLPLVLAIVVVLLLLAGGGGWYFMQQGHNKTDAAAKPSTESTASAVTQAPAQSALAAPAQATDTKASTPLPTATVNATPVPAQSKETPAARQAAEPQKQVAQAPQTQAPAQTQNPAPAPVQQPVVAMTIGAATPAPTLKSESTPSAPQQIASDVFVPFEKNPEVTKLVTPDVSRIIQRSGGGKVMVQVQIDTHGKATSAKIVSSTNSQLNDSVIEAAMRSEYSPGMMSSGPVNSTLRLPFQFR